MYVYIYIYVYMYVYTYIYIYIDRIGSLGTPLSLYMALFRFIFAGFVSCYGKWLVHFCRLGFTIRKLQVHVCVFIFTIRKLQVHFWGAWKYGDSFLWIPETGWFNSHAIHVHMDFR